MTNFASFFFCSQDVRNETTMNRQQITAVPRVKSFNASLQSLIFMYNARLNHYFPRAFRIFCFIRLIAVFCFKGGQGLDIVILEFQVVLAGDIFHRLLDMGTDVNSVPVDARIIGPV